MNKTASIGSILHGTLRPEDLFEAFFYELERIAKRQEDSELSKYLERINVEASEMGDDSEELVEIVQELFDKLDGYAPDFCYFGANEGDGSDFGFWPCLDALDDDSVYVVRDGIWPIGTIHQDYVAEVNDHGSITLFAVDHSTNDLSEIWSIG